MEKSALFHLSESIYSYPINENTVLIRLRTKKDDDILKISLVYNAKYEFHERVFEQEMKKECSDSTFDYYTVKVTLTDLRFAYVFKIETLTGQIYYFSESGCTQTYDITKGFYDFFQVPYINQNDLVPIHKKLQNSVFYQIFVDRFAKSKDNQNERINIKWGDLVGQKSIAGGNLKGIIEKLDYLENLGINALYLTPIFESPSNHKYNISNYYKIASDFGNEKDFEALVTKAHQKNMMVVLDGVFNHISSDNEIFIDACKEGKASKYFNWFFVHGDEIDQKNPNYECFASAYDMPRLNLNNPEVEQYVIDVGTYYIEKYHIDGYRLDVSDEIPHRFWIRFKEAMRKVKPDFFLIGENWHNAQSFLNSGFEFDSIMNYTITKEVLRYLTTEEYSTLDFKNHIVSDLMRYKENVNYNLFNLLSSHDVYRFFTECKLDVDKYLLGYAFIFTHIGVPCVYYGDEIGLEGKYDPDSRRCFPWKEEEWNQKIYLYMRNFIQIHRQYKLNERDYQIEVKDEMLYIKRSDDKTDFILWLNYSQQDKMMRISEYLLANNYENGILKHKGFIMIVKEREK